MLMDTPSEPEFLTGGDPLVLLWGGLACIAVLVIIIVARRGRDQLDNQEALFRQRSAEQAKQIEDLTQVKGKEQDSWD